jgi:hypothetical protein
MADTNRKRNLPKMHVDTLTVPKRTQEDLLTDLRLLITETRSAVAVTINAGLTLLYWRVGVRIHREILGKERAEYGEQIVHALSAQLRLEFGEGFGKRNLFNMIRFAEVFPDEHVVRSLVPTLSWTHIRLIIYIDDPLKRDFYAEMSRIERWSTRTLQQKIDSMLFERTALFKKTGTSGTAGTFCTPYRGQDDSGSGFSRSLYSRFSPAQRYI